MTITLNCMILGDDDTDINDVIDSYSDRSSLDTSIEYNDSYKNTVNECIKKGKIHLTKYKLINGVLQSTDSLKRHKNETANLIFTSFDFEDSFLWQTRRIKKEIWALSTTKFKYDVPSILVVVAKELTPCDMQNCLFSHNFDLFTKVDIMKDIGVLDYVVCGGDKTQNIRNLDAALHKFFDVSKSRVRSWIPEKFKSLKEKMQFTRKSEEKAIELDEKILIQDEELHNHCNLCFSSSHGSASNVGCEMTTCINSCGAIFHRCKEQEHVILCKKVITSCINRNNGCNERMSRGMLNDHLQNCSPIMARYHEYGQMSDKYKELWNGIMQYGFLFGYEQRQFILPAPESKLPIHAAIWKLYPKFLANGIIKSKKHSEVVVEEEGSPTFLNDGSKTLDESSIQSNASDTLEMRVMRRNATKHLRKDTYSICSTCNGSDGYCQIVSEDISCTNDDNVVNQSLDIDKYENTDLDNSLSKRSVNTGYDPNSNVQILETMSLEYLDQLLYRGVNHSHCSDYSAVQYDSVLEKTCQNMNDSFKSLDIDEQHIVSDEHEQRNADVEQDTLSNDEEYYNQRSSAYFELRQKFIILKMYFSDDECKIVCCVHDCGAIFHGCKAKEHIMMCPEVNVDCINTENGCNKKIKRKDMFSHLGICPAMVERRYDYNQLPKLEIGQISQSDCTTLYLPTWGIGDNIAVNGCRLSFNIEKGDYAEIHTAHPIPNELEQYYFEVTIIACGTFGIGIQGYSDGLQRSMITYTSMVHCSNHWFYHSDGTTEDVLYEKYGNGDVIGCYLYRVLRGNHCYNLVKFTKNGKEIVQKTYFHDPVELHLHKENDLRNRNTNLHHQKPIQLNLEHKFLKQSPSNNWHSISSLHPFIFAYGTDLEVETNFGSRSFLYHVEDKQIEENKEYLWHCINRKSDLDVDGSSIIDLTTTERNEPCLISTLQPVSTCLETFYFEVLITHIGAGKCIKVGYRSKQMLPRFCFDKRLSIASLKSGDIIGCRLRLVNVSSHIYYIVDYTKNGLFVCSSEILEKINVLCDEVICSKPEIYPTLLLDSAGSILYTNLGEGKFMFVNCDIISWKGMPNQKNVQIHGSSIIDSSPIDSKKWCIVSTSQPIPKVIDTFYFETRIVQMGVTQRLKIGYCSEKHIVEYDGNRIRTGKFTSGDTIGCRLRRMHVAPFDYYIVDYAKNGKPISSRVILEKCLAEKYETNKSERMKIYPIISFNSPGLILVTDHRESEFFSGNDDDNTDFTAEDLWNTAEENQSRFMTLNQARVICIREHDELSPMKEPLLLTPIHKSISKIYFEIEIQFNPDISNQAEEFNFTSLPDTIIGIKSEGISFKYTSFGNQVLFDEEQKKVLYKSESTNTEYAQNVLKRLIVGFHVIRKAVNGVAYTVVQMTLMGKRLFAPRTFQGDSLHPIVLLNYSPHSINPLLGTNISLNTGNKTFYYNPEISHLDENTIILLKTFEKQSDEKQNYIFAVPTHLLVIGSETIDLNKRRILTSSIVPSRNLEYNAYIKLRPNVKCLEVGLTSDSDEVVFDCLDMSLEITKKSTGKKQSIRSKKVDMDMSEECLFEWKLQLVNEYDNCTRIFTLTINGFTVIYHEVNVFDGQNMDTMNLDKYVLDGCNVRPFVSFQLGPLEALKLEIGLIADSTILLHNQSSYEAYEAL